MSRLGAKQKKRSVLGEPQDGQARWSPGRTPEKVLADEGEWDTLGKFHDIIVAVWRGGGVPRQWR